MTSKLSVKWHWLLIFVVCITVALASNGSGVNSSAAPQISVTQDIRNLENRINSLEQRFYSMESNINRLQQQIAYAGRSTPSSSSRDPEIDTLRNELEALKARIREVECGVAHIDERTLSATAKARRRTSDQSKDPCRQSPEEPVQLTLRR